MKYTNGNESIEAYKWNGNVLAGSEKGTPKWIGDAILITHRIWFDAAWNMKVDTNDGMKMCNVDDYIIKRLDGSLDVVSHDDFKDGYRKVK